MGAIRFTSIHGAEPKKNVTNRYMVETRLMHPYVEYMIGAKHYTLWGDGGHKVGPWLPSVDRWQWPQVVKHKYTGQLCYSRDGLFSMGGRTEHNVGLDAQV